MVKLVDLTPNDRNPRTIRTEDFKRLCDSIQRDPQFMVLRPIVHKNGQILGGNMRWRACKELGMTEIPDEWVCNAPDLTEEQAKRFILVDNTPEGMGGEWDWEILASDWEVPELEELGFAMPEIELSSDNGEPSTSDVSVVGVPSTIAFPPSVWLRQRAEIIDDLTSVIAQYGGHAEWAE